MIRDGYAYSYKQYPHPRLAEYNQLEQEARDASRGLWSVCSTGAGDFTDVSASHPYLEAIRWGKETGVLSGYPRYASSAAPVLSHVEICHDTHQALRCPSGHVGRT
jgi:hypothetical protein